MVCLEFSFAYVLRMLGIRFPLESDIYSRHCRRNCAIEFLLMCNLNWIVVLWFVWWWEVDILAGPFESHDGFEHVLPPCS